jgi:hypothetical protein
VQEGERRARQCSIEAQACGPGQHSARQCSSNEFKHFKFDSNVPKRIGSKQDLSGLKKFKIKYGWQIFEIRNNFDYINFLRIRMDFELKFREASRS